jgi:hypothetical protein
MADNEQANTDDALHKELKLALVSFQAAMRDWRDLLAAPRPEYVPRWQIGTDQPTGW